MAAGFLYDPATKMFTTLEFNGATSTQALGLNNKGEVVGFYVDSAGASHGFTEMGGVFQTVDATGGVGTTTINGVNDQGLLVGFFVDANGNIIGLLATLVPEPRSLALLAIGTAAVIAIAVRRRLLKRDAPA
jgi:hypothetical protein